jgi:Zn-dependent protease with chaperone function
VTDLARTMVAVEPGSAWLVMSSVSLATFPVVVLVRRLIRGPGGVACALALGLPLLLPLVAAIVYWSTALPEVVVLRPAVPALLQSSGGPLQVVFIGQDPAKVVVPYVFSTSSRAVALALTGALCCYAGIRRLSGRVFVSRLLRRCRAPRAAWERRLVAATAELSRAVGLRHTPRLLVLPGRDGQAMAMGFRRATIVVSEALPEVLDDEEMEAVVAHEVAHLANRDAQLVAVAGFLRDIMAWNPIAHLAFRRLARDRELEADERAAAITGKPLALASGLLAIWGYLSEGCSRRRSLQAASFLTPRGHIAPRVERMVALADGKLGARRHPHAYLVVVAMVTILGLKVAGGVAERSGALSLMWNAPSASQADIWAPRTSPSLERRPRTERKQRADRAATQRPSEAKDNPGYYKQLLERNIALRQRDFPELVGAVSALAERRGIVPLELSGLSAQRWQAVPVFEGAPGASFGIYRVQEEPLHLSPPSRAEQKGRLAGKATAE